MPPITNVLIDSSPKRAWRSVVLKAPKRVLRTMRSASRTSRAGSMSKDGSPSAKKSILFHGVKSLVVVWDRVVVIRCERHSHEHKFDAVGAGPAQCDLSPIYQGVPVGDLGQYRWLEIQQHHRR